MLLAQRAALPQGRFDIISSALVGNYNDEAGRKL